MASKIPVFGNMYAKFIPEAMRIAKNDIVKRPLYSIAWASLMTMLYYMFKSKDEGGDGLTGEEKEVYKEFTTSIPRGAPQFHYNPNKKQWEFNDVPLFLVVGGKRIDIARFIEPQYIWDQGDDYKSYIQWINKVSPVPMAGEVDHDTRAHKFFPQFADPILGPVFQVAFDMDFRLRSIQDPNAGPWGADPNITSDERMLLS